MKQLRGPKHENWPVCDPRAAPPPAEYGLAGLKSGENGHLARANGAIDGPYCSSTWPSVFGRRCEPLVGRGGGFGGWSCTSQRPQAARGALLQIDWRLACVLKRAVPRPSGAAPAGLARMALLCQCFSGGPGGGEAVAFYKPCQMCKKKASAAVHVTRW
jgi:hypothetical protein